MWIKALRLGVTGMAGRYRGFIIAAPASFAVKLAQIKVSGVLRQRQGGVNFRGIAGADREQVGREDRAPRRASAVHTECGAGLRRHDIGQAGYGRRLRNGGEIHEYAGGLGAAGNHVEAEDRRGIGQVRENADMDDGKMIGDFQQLHVGAAEAGGGEQRVVPDQTRFVRRLRWRGQSFAAGTGLQ